MGKVNVEEEEQVQDTPEEEKVEEPSEPQDVGEAVRQFNEEKEKEEKEKLSSETEEEPEDTPQKEEGEERKEKLVPSFWILDKDGNKTPAVFKADGKDYAPDSLEKLMTWASFGIHRKMQADELEKARPFLELMQKAYQEGRLILDGDPVLPADLKAKMADTKEEPEEEAEDEEESLDPETAALKKEVRDLKERDQKRSRVELENMIKGERTKLEGEISRHREGGFFAAVIATEENSPKEVWELLGELDENKKPKYTVEEAMKISHESQISFAKELMKKHPKEFDIDEDGIYARKLKEKKEREEASVSSPSEAPAATDTKPEERDFQNPQEAYEAFKKEYKKKVEIAQKT